MVLGFQERLFCHREINVILDTLTMQRCAATTNQTGNVITASRIPRQPVALNTFMLISKHRSHSHRIDLFTTSLSSDVHHPRQHVIAPRLFSSSENAFTCRSRPLNSFLPHLCYLVQIKQILFNPHDGLVYINLCLALTPINRVKNITWCVPLDILRCRTFRVPGQYQER